MQAEEASTDQLRAWAEPVRGAHRRWGGLAIAAAVATVGLAACGGGSPSSPHVARLGTTTTTVGGHGRGSAAPKSGNATQLMDEWATCMRAHGVPNYPSLNSAHNNQLNFMAAGVDPNTATFVNANKICGKQVKAPAWWIAGTGPPGDVVVSSAGIGPNGPVAGNRPRSGTIPVGGNGGAASGG